MNSEEKFDFSISSLGPCTIQSPIKLSTTHGDYTANYVRDDSYVIANVNVYDTKKPIVLDSSNLMEKAGPREKIFFDPTHAKAGICTCGGLCPGLNDVIRAIVRCLNTRYGVKTIKGYQFGFRGFFADSGYEPLELDRYLIDEIHKIGGTYLGTSRGGGERTSDIVDCLERDGINMLFILGGDGTQRGAYDVACEVEKRGLKCAVVGVPKTVDNDLMFMDRSFGFETAVQRAKETIAAVHMEAASQIGGIGLVKLMGRESGFIAAAAALSSHETNFCLIPEVPFELEGDSGFLACLERRLAKRGHAVIVVAEGAGQDLLDATNATDASGNKKLSDIGVFLKKEIEKYFKEKKIEINLKYIDPSYQVRASVTTASDSIYCERLGNNAVHAAMAGKTKLVIGLVHDKFVHLPIKAVTAHRNAVDPEGSFWRDTLDATGQPILMVKDEKSAQKKMAAAVAGAKSKPSEQKKNK